MREVFVYYRVHAVHAAEARRAVARMQSDLRSAFPGLAARLLVRDDDDAGGAQTWMETYSRAATHAAAGVDAELERAIVAQALRLASYIDGPRHVEVFDGVD